MDKQQRVQVLDDFDNSDLTAVRHEYHFRTPFLIDMLSPVLKDQRDVPMLCLLLNILQFLVPAIFFLYYLNLMCDPLPPLWVRNFIGLGYIVILAVCFFERFILCMHFSSHRPIFKSGLLNESIVWLFAPFFGVPCGLYKVHHVVMHHIENNHDFDVSSTEHYQRDSLWHFLCYWFRFTVLIWAEVPFYTYRVRRWDLTSTVFAGGGIYVALVLFLAKCVSLHATVWVFVVPFAVAFFAMSFGNWSQHIFVNPDNPESNFELTYNCIDAPGNQTTFNDGYHIIHHWNARLHWSEMPKYFHDNREKHITAGAVTFRGIHFFDVGILVMTKQLRKLATHYVHLGIKEDAPTIDEIEAKLRSWLTPITWKTGKAAKKTM